MSTEIIKIEPRVLGPAERGSRPPAIVEDSGKPAMFAYAEFFEPELENDNTHVAYRCAVNRFLAWCEDRGFEFQRVSPGAVTNYIRNLTTRKGTPASKPTQNSTSRPDPPRSCPVPRLAVLCGRWVRQADSSPPPR